MHRIVTQFLCKYFRAPVEIRSRRRLPPTLITYRIFVLRRQQGRARSFSSDRVQQRVAARRPRRPLEGPDLRLHAASA